MPAICHLFVCSFLTLDQLPRPTAPKLLLGMYHFNIIKWSSPDEVLLEISKTIIRALVLEKSPVDQYIFRMKSVSLTTNMAIFRKIITPISNLSKYVSLLVYFRYLAETFKVKVRGLSTRIFKTLGNSAYFKSYCIYKLN